MEDLILNLMKEIEVSPVIPCNECKNVFRMQNYQAPRTIAAEAAKAGWSVSEPFGAVCPECTGHGQAQEDLKQQRATEDSLDFCTRKV